MGLVCVITIHLIGPQAHAVDLTIDSGETPISTDTSAGNIFVGTNGVDTGTLTVGSGGTDALNVTGSNVSITGTGYISVSTGSFGTGVTSGPPQLNQASVNTLTISNTLSGIGTLS